MGTLIGRAKEKNNKIRCNSEFIKMSDTISLIWKNKGKRKKFELKMFYQVHVSFYTVKVRMLSFVVTFFLFYPFFSEYLTNYHSSFASKLDSYQEELCFGPSWAQKLRFGPYILHN